MEGNKLCSVAGKSIFFMDYGLDEKYYKYIDMKLAISKKLSELIGLGVDGFICSAEYGFPLWVCEILLGMRSFNKAKLFIVMPFEEQAVKWTDEVRERFYDVHANADEVKMIRRQYHEDCYRICDKIIVDKGDMLLTDDLGGFAAQYAEISGKPVNTYEALSRNC